MIFMNFVYIAIHLIVEINQKKQKKYALYTKVRTFFWFYCTNKQSLTQRLNDFICLNIQKLHFWGFFY